MPVTFAILKRASLLLLALSAVSTPSQSQVAAVNMSSAASNDGDGTSGIGDAASIAALCDKTANVLQNGTSPNTAMIVMSTCTARPVPFNVTSGVLTATRANLTRVDSFPAIVKSIDVSSNGLTGFKPKQSLEGMTEINLNFNKIPSFSSITVPRSLETLQVSFTYLTSFDGFKYPYLKGLYAGGNCFPSLDEFQIPQSLTLLYLHDNCFRGKPALQVEAIKQWPKDLALLNLMNNGLTSEQLDQITLPVNLARIDLSNNSLTKVPKLSDMTNLQSLKLHLNKIPSMTNLKLPPAMSEVSLNDNAIETIKGVVFPFKMTMLNLTNNPIKTLEISDDQKWVFDKAAVYYTVSPEFKCDAPAKPVTLSTSGLPICVLAKEEFDKRYDLDNAKGKSAGSSNGWVLPVVIVCVCVILVGIFGVFVYRRKQHKHKDDFRTLDLQNGSQNNTGGFSTHNGTGKHTIFDGTELSGTNLDTTLLKHRIPSHEIVLESALAKGGYGIVYVARYQNRRVVVKKILPEKANDDATLKNFLDEIRLCATLEHPKIVSFLGVTWNTLADVSVVIEYMPNGDLDCLLKRQKERKTSMPNEFQWYESMRPLPPKISIAVDVVEAIVYLHSFSSPIIHRDLKSRNVLLSDTFAAKISDFGVSREWSVDATMTAGIGTMAWIAPEVLRGERYTEKADIYSFGVILTELATCEKPFDGVTNTVVVLKVTTGEERPDIGVDCPNDVRDLANRCLSFNPSDRPSAMVVHYELKTLLRVNCASDLMSR